MALEKLPGWALHDSDVARANVERWRRMSPAERWREVEDCAKDAMWAVRASRSPERVLMHESPLPASTLRALARLRASSRRASTGARRPRRAAIADGWSR